MAVRPVFVPDEKRYVKTIDTTFTFFSGFSRAQKQRCVDSLHEAYGRAFPDTKILEVSNFSKEDLGIALSAFNLMLQTQDGRKPLEVIFQAGKVFEHGGPYKDLLGASPRAAKKDPRLAQSGRIIGFDFEGRSIPTEPKTLFYTWLYLRALNENRDLAERVSTYGAFTDIAFNPQKSINCQAYACAVYVSLRRKAEADRAVEDIEFLSKILTH